MNTHQDTIATLLPDAQSMTRFVLDSARDTFEKFNQVDCCAFVPAKNKSTPEALGIKKLDDETKPFVWACLRLLRKTHPVVGFVSETWVVKEHPENVNPDGSVKVMPHDHPDRSEQVMFQLWQGPRAVTFCADIKRNPDSLGEWKVMFDSDFPIGKKHEVKGALMEGDHYPLQEN